MLGCCLTSSLTLPSSRSSTVTSHCGFLLLPQVSTRTEGHGPAGQLPTESEEIGVAHDPSEGGGHLLAGDKRSVTRRAPGDLAQRGGAVEQSSLRLSALLEGYDGDPMSTPTASCVANTRVWVAGGGTPLV